jgi:hypothetical protein
MASLGLTLGAIPSNGRSYYTSLPGERVELLSFVSTLLPKPIDLVLERRDLHFLVVDFFLLSFESALQSIVVGPGFSQTSFHYPLLCFWFIQLVLWSWASGTFESE